MALLEIPIIDTAPFRRGLADDKRRVAYAVNQACEDIGFLVITGHGIDPELCRRTIEVSRAFFDLPEEEKSTVKRPAFDIPRGYSGVAQEGLVYSLDKESPGDL